MSADEKYALNWSSHADHIKEAFDKILEASDFVDVTLSCEGKRIKAHRVILSACSPYFYDLLKDNPCTHPTLILRGMKYDNIKYLLKFMYCGEVQVPTEHFSSFLQTAEVLQISGLTGSNDPTSQHETKPDKEIDTTIHEKIKPLPASVKSSNVTSKRKNSSDEIIVNSKKKKESEPIESDEDLSGSDSKEDNETNNVMNAGSMENLPNIEKLLSDNTFLSKEANPECECPVCAEKFISIYMLKQHIPFHLGETKCRICGKVQNRLDLLKKHLIQVHKIHTNPGKKER